MPTMAPTPETTRRPQALCALGLAALAVAWLWWEFAADLVLR